jgi:hypothetical protein
MAAITTQDLTNVLRDLIQPDTDLQDIRDARRAATVLSPDDCKAALLEALTSRGIEIGREYE